MPQRSQLRRRKPSHSSKQKSTSSTDPQQENLGPSSLQKILIKFQPVLLVFRSLFLGLAAAASLSRDDVSVIVFGVSLSTMLGGLLRVYMSVLKQNDLTPIELPAVYHKDGTVLTKDPISVKDHDLKVAGQFACELPCLGAAAAWMYIWSSFRPALTVYGAYIMYRFTYHPLFRIHLFHQPHCAEFERPWGGVPLFRNSSDEPVKVVAGMTAFDQALEDAGEGKLVIVDFSAPWCAPCKAMAPEFRKLAEDFPDCVFLNVDVGVSQDVAAKMGITSIPTFILFKDGERVELMRGASSKTLRETIERQM